MQILFNPDNYLCILDQTRRYFIEIAFKGTAYHGWQIQQNAVSVQEILNKALSTILRQNIETVGCGRTDTGVHASQLFAHFDLILPSSDSKLQTPNFQLIISLNSILPYDIAVKRLFQVLPNTHARFDAVMRSYQYHIHFEKDPFRQGISWLLRDKPDLDLMNRGASIIMEYRDFSCFSKSNTQTFTNNCLISKAEWRMEGDVMIFHISADRFLRNMVRAIVGTLIKVGKGELEPEAIREIIESKSRSNAGMSVPACGLFLTEVKYPFMDDLINN